MPDTFFNPHQRATVEAAMARIIPTDDTPGAREAGCIDFVDRYLSGIGYIFAKPDGSGFETLEGRLGRSLDAAHRDHARPLRRRHRATSTRAPRQSFRPTSSRWRRSSRTRSCTRSSRRAPAQPTTLAVGDALAGPVSPQPALQQTSTEVDLDFLPLLITHTRQGFYADPIYGGNRDRIGWKVIGFPGPASLKDVHTGRYTTLQYFADGEADKVREFHDGL